MRKNTLLGMTLAALMVGSAGAKADVVFQIGNHPQNNEENILFQTSESGTTISGATNQSNVTFNFTTSPFGGTLYQNAQGQADILSVDGPPSQSALRSMDITAPGHAWTDFIMNPLNAIPDVKDGTVTATVTAIDNNNNVFTYDLGNGQNYLTMYTINDEFIKEITLTLTGGAFEEFKQPRVSGVCTLVTSTSCDPDPVPEPGSMLLLGAGLIGIVGARRFFV